MQSALPGSRDIRRPASLLGIPVTTLPTLVLVFLLALCAGGSTVAANWVPGSGVITPLTLVAAFLMTVLGLARRVHWALALVAWVLLAPIAAFVSAHQALTQAHPQDPANPLALIAVWGQRIASGQAANDVSFYLYLLCLLFWGVGGWLAWCVLRWRQPILGVVPAAAAVATNVLNYPDNQAFYTLAVLVLTMGLLLWSTYVAALRRAARRRIRLSGDARWDFWESGVVVMAAVIVLGLILPPLSAVDRTVSIQNAGFQDWAALQQRLEHPIPIGTSPGGGGTSSGLALLAGLTGPLHTSDTVVFTYKVSGVYGPPAYFRALNLDTTSAGVGGPSWRFVGQGAIQEPVHSGRRPPLAPRYQDLRLATFTVNMVKPPSLDPSLLPYPGQLDLIDRDAVASSTPVDHSRPTRTRGELDTIDLLAMAQGSSSSGTYQVTAAYSVADASQLEHAGTGYPAWIQPYRRFGPDYRPASALARIHQLALQITAGLTDPYEQATAIQDYLRTHYQYTLTPLVAPQGTDPVVYFLFDSKQGYCQYFATAMGDMLRSLGIPTRLVNGYGPGTYDPTTDSYVVRESDAHTWVEAWFPHYGWIPFEPTPAPGYQPIPRGVPSACAGVTCSVPAAGAVGSITNGAIGGGRVQIAKVRGAGTAATARSSFPALTVALVVLVLVVAGAGLAGSRYLRPHSVSRVWGRASQLAALAGVRRQPGETPLEYGTRLARDIPEAAGPAAELARSFTVAAYAPREVAATSREEVMAAWAELRPILLRRLGSRVRPTGSR
jgi:hypothetical protein